MRRAGTWGLLACLASCDVPAPSGDLAGGGEPEARPDPAPTPARYLTHLVFVGVRGSFFHGSFDQAVATDRLTRRYDAWSRTGETWRQLLRVRDTLPTPRAGWRILPTERMAVRVGDAGQVVELAFREGGGAGDGTDEGGAADLVAGEELSVWTGPTGQRESLGSGALELGGDPEPGLLFFRRAVRARGLLGDGGEARTFLLVDSIGNGLLLQLGEPPEPASARTWLHGNLASWAEVLFEAVPDTAPGDWRFEISGTELSGVIRRSPSDSAATGGPEPGAHPALVVECILTAGEERFRFAGIATTLSLP